MLLEAIGGIILFVFGIFAIYFSLSEGYEDSHLLAVLIVGFLCIIVGGWAILSQLTLAFLLRKLTGLILLGLGFFLIWGFPDITDYQPDDMSKTGVFLGVILFLIGVYLLVF